MQIQKSITKLNLEVQNIYIKLKISRTPHGFKLLLGGNFKISPEYHNWLLHIYKKSQSHLAINGCIWSPCRSVRSKFVLMFILIRRCAKFVRLKRSKNKIKIVNDFLKLKSFANCRSKVVVDEQGIQRDTRTYKFYGPIFLL